MSQKSALSPSLFGIVLITFLFPWMDISCGNQHVSVSGVDLVLGKQFSRNERDHIDTQPAAIVTLALAALGVLYGVAKVSTHQHRITSAVLGIAAALSLLWVRYEFERYIIDTAAGNKGGSRGDSQAPIIVEPLWGYWCGFLVVIAIVALNVYLLRTENGPSQQGTSCSPVE